MKTIPSNSYLVSTQVLVRIQNQVPDGNGVHQAVGNVLVQLGHIVHNVLVEGCEASSHLVGGLRAVDVLQVGQRSWILPGMLAGVGGADDLGRHGERCEG